MNSLNYMIHTLIYKIKYILSAKTYSLNSLFNNNPNKVFMSYKVLYIFVDTLLIFVLGRLINNLKNTTTYYTEDLSAVKYSWLPNTPVFKRFLVVNTDINRTYIGLKINIVVYNVKWILLSMLISLLYIFISLFYIQIDLTKQLAVWYIILIAYYLVISGFNTFLNKYRYGKFTSAIQRFWKRTGMIFWLIEGFLFLLFFYYFLNSSQEPMYMFDYSNLNQELLIQLKVSYKNMILISLAIYLSFILLLNINFYMYYQSILVLLIISLIIFYTLYIESYQFVYILGIFADKDWVFNDMKQIWLLELEQSNLRVKQQYFVLCLVAKYWHFIFIFISWFFFLIKTLEASKVSITLLGYNVQNLLILYILNVLCLAQWLKYFLKKFLEITYYWFFIQYDEKFYINSVNELWLILSNYFTYNVTTHIVQDIKHISQIMYFSNESNLWLYA